MSSSNFYKKWDILLVQLDPVQGSEVAKTRPCLVISPNAINRTLNTIIIAPFTSTQKAYPSRLNTLHKGKAGAIAFDQLRTVDKSRIVKRDGTLDKTLRETANSILNIMFSEK